MGGSAQTWTATLRDGLLAGSPIELRLVMTKFGPPAVDLTYEILIQ